MSRERPQSVLPRPCERVSVKDLSRPKLRSCRRALVNGIHPITWRPSAQNKRNDLNELTRPSEPDCDIGVRCFRVALGASASLEGAVQRTNLWNDCASRVTLDQRRVRPTASLSASSDYSCRMPQRRSPGSSDSFILFQRRHL